MNTTPPVVARTIDSLGQRTPQPITLSELDMLAGAFPLSIQHRPQGWSLEIRSAGQDNFGFSEFLDRRGLLPGQSFHSPHCVSTETWSDSPYWGRVWWFIQFKGVLPLAGLEGPLGTPDRWSTYTLDLPARRIVQKRHGNLVKIINFCD